MAGSATAVVSKAGDRSRSRIEIEWTSHTDGSAAVSLDSIGTPRIAGNLMRAEFIPGTGDDQPSDLYDVTLTDDYGLDVLGGQGANLSQTNKTDVMPGVPLKDGTTTSVAPRYIDNELTLNVSNAGSVNKGKVILYLQ